LPVEKVNPAPKSNGYGRFVVGQQIGSGDFIEKRPCAAGISQQA